MPGLQPVRRINFNDIKARLKRRFMFFEKHRSCGAQTLLLAKVYKLARRAEMRRPAQLDLGKDEILRVLGNDIDLAVAAAVVGRDNMIAPLAKKRCRQRLAPRTELCVSRRHRTF